MLLTTNIRSDPDWTLIGPGTAALYFDKCFIAMHIP